MTTALKQFDKIDAFTVTMTQLRMGCTWRRKMPVGKKTSSFSAIDALPNEGVTWVCKGELTATFLYATPGAEGVRQGLKIVKGEKVEKKITLPTMAVDKTNCEQIRKENGLT
jgi:ribose transport system substrate-binding protein